MNASNHKALFLNINGYGHRSGDATEDEHGIEEAIRLYCRSGPDTIFLVESRVRIKHIKSLVEEGISEAGVIFHPTTCTPGASEANSIQCMGGMIIIISPEWANLKYRARLKIWLRPLCQTGIQFWWAQNQN
jgi:hypothetical protein